jgi:hypothetical protein
MGLGVVTTGGGGGEVSVEASRPLELPLRDVLSMSLSEEMEPGREMVSTEDVRRITLPIRADHFGLVLGLVIAGNRRKDVAQKRGW